MGSGISQKWWINLLGFQLAWWLAIVFGTSATAVMGLLLLLHLVFHSSPWLEAQVVLIVALLGFLLDTLLMYSGVFVFAEHSLTPPLWLLMLWLCFAATLRQSLNWLADKPLAASLFAALGGPLSYLAGERLGAVSFGHPIVITLLVLAVVWALLLPSLLLLVKQLASKRVVSVC